MRSSRLGYTLIELLVVIAILAILFTVGITTYRNARWRAQVREGLATVASTLREARSTAQRFNISARVRFPSDRELILEARDRTGTVHRSYTRKLPPYLSLDYSKNGSTWKPITDLGAVTYTAPFGETSASATILRVRHLRRSGTAACLRIVGVTGKVVVARACP